MAGPLTGQQVLAQINALNRQVISSFQGRQPTRPAAPVPQAQRDLSKYGFLGASERANTRAAAQQRQYQQTAARLGTHAEPITTQLKREYALQDTAVRQANANNGMGVVTDPAAIKHLDTHPGLADQLGLAKFNGRYFKKPTHTSGAALLEHLPGGQYLSQAATQIGQGFGGIPAALYNTGKALYHDTGAVLHGNAPTHLYHQVLVPAAHGFERDFTDPTHNIGNLLMDVATLASGGAAAASKLGLLEAPLERSVAFGEGRVQPPASPNTLTRVGQHAYDRFSERHPLAPGVGAVDRVARRLPLERERAFQRMASEAAPFQAAASRLNRGERFAYDVMARYGDKATARLEQEVKFREQKLRDATTGVERAHQRKRLAQLHAARQHVLNPSTALTQTVDLGRELTGKAQATKIDLGQLTPETAALHIHQSSEIATGRAAGKGAFYMPDVAQNAPRAITGRVAGLGKPRSIVKQSQGILFNQGRVRATPAVTLENFQRTARYAAKIADIQAARKFAKPVNPDTLNGLDEGYRHFNPEGVKLPRSLRDVPPQDQLEGMSPAEVEHAIQQEIGAVHANVFPTEADVAKLPPDVQKKLLQLPEPIARAFEQRTSTGLPLPQSRVGRKLLSVLDASNNLTKDALIYLKPSYVPQNFAGNLVFGGIHQGVWLPKNLAKAAGTLGRVSAENLRRIDHEVGAGGAVGLAQDSRGPLARGTQKIAGVMGALADRLPRRAAFIHEAAKRGYKTDAQLNQLFTDEKLQPVLNQVNDAANRAMVDFRVYSPFERKVISRAIFVWPWIKGATRYGLRLPIDYPLRANVLTHAGETQQAEIQKILGRLPSYLQGVFPIGAPEQRLGSTLVPVLNPASEAPLGTVGPFVRGVSSLVQSQPQAAQLGQFANPLLQAGIGAAFHVNTQTGAAYPGTTTGSQILWQDTLGGSPIVRLAETLLHPQPQQQFRGSPATQRLYVPDTRGEAIARFAAGSGFVPRELNVPASQEKAHQEQRQTMTAAQKLQDDTVTIGRRMLNAAKLAGLEPKTTTANPPVVDEALKRWEAYRSYILAAKQHLGRRMTVEDQYVTDIQWLTKQGVGDAKAAKLATDWAKTATDKQLHDQRSFLHRKFADAFTPTVLRQALTQLRHAGHDIRLPPAPR